MQNRTGIYSLFFGDFHLSKCHSLWFVFNYPTIIEGENPYPGSMFLQRLSLLNYKNFESADFDFDSKINCVVGPNGIGKTNILDSIYHLAFGKGYFNPIASQNIKHDTEFFVIEGAFEKNGRAEKIVCSLKRGAKKNHKT